MEKVIGVSKLLGNDIRSRCNAEAIKNEIVLAGNTAVCIDMTGVQFISRSFADELLNIIAVIKSTRIRLANDVGEVASMIRIVSESRKRGRIVDNGNGSMIELKDMKSLNEFFAAMQ